MFSITDFRLRKVKYETEAGRDAYFFTALTLEFNQPWFHVVTQRKVSDELSQHCLNLANREEFNNPVRETDVEFAITQLNLVSPEASDSGLGWRIDQLSRVWSVQDVEGNSPVTVFVGIDVKVI